MKLTGENRSTRGKTCPSATLSTTNPTWYTVLLVLCLSDRRSLLYYCVVLFKYSCCCHSVTGSLICLSCGDKRKRYSNPITGLDRPLGFQEVEAPRFVDNRHMKVLRLSALRTGRLYPPGNIPGTHFC
jgi:hypothetical protein